MRLRVVMPIEIGIDTIFLDQVNQLQQDTLSSEIQISTTYTAESAAVGGAPMASPRRSKIHMKALCKSFTMSCWSGLHYQTHRSSLGSWTSSYSQPNLRQSRRVASGQ